MPDQRCSTCTATTCRRAAAGRRSPAIVRLLGAVDVAPPAVRTAVSRMVREGWLEPVEQQGQRGYARDGAGPGPAGRGAQPHLPHRRPALGRHAGTWSSSSTPPTGPRAGGPPRRWATSATPAWRRTRGSPPGPAAELAQLAGRRGSWAAAQFLARYTEPGARAGGRPVGPRRPGGGVPASSSPGPQELTAGLEADLTPERGFAVRSLLVHEWRKFLFRDPGLPGGGAPAGLARPRGRDVLRHDRRVAAAAGPTRSWTVAYRPTSRPGAEPHARAGRHRDRPPDPTAAPVLLDVDGGVATVTFNRADAMNALDTADQGALRRPCSGSPTTPAVRCVVLTGTGRAFCVGQDLREHIGLLQRHRTSRCGQTVPEHYNPIVELIATMNKPVIAAVNGVAAGAGAAFAFAADLRVAGRHGRLQPRLRRHRAVLRLRARPGRSPGSSARPGPRSCC